MKEMSRKKTCDCFWLPGLLLFELNHFLTSTNSSVNFLTVAMVAPSRCKIKMVEKQKQYLDSTKWNLCYQRDKNRLLSDSNFHQTVAFHHFLFLIEKFFIQMSWPHQIFINLKPTRGGIWTCISGPWVSHSTTEPSIRPKFLRKVKSSLSSNASRLRSFIAIDLL